MQTTVQKKDAVRIGSVIFSADFGQGYVNLGALKNANFSITKNVTELVFDNAKQEPQVSIEEAILSADLHEIHLPNIHSIDGMGELTNTPGTQQTITDENYGEVGTALRPFKLLHSNGNGTVITVDSIKAGGGNVSASNYNVYEENGETYIVFKTAQTGDITVSYKYTPNANVSILFKDIITSLKTNKFKFENIRNGKKFTIEFFKGYNRSNMEIGFTADKETDDTSSVTVEIKAFPTEDQELFRITDEQSV